jgi:NAD(P)-dependent dehydrogenase (short-subunit alcohol dehydrogenase family)
MLSSPFLNSLKIKNSKTMIPKIWLITGISSGLGQALARAVIAEGDFVVGTFRSPDQAAAFSQQYAGRALGIRLDVTAPVDIQAAADLVREQFGRLDVLVNNAGVGFAGAIEETSREEVAHVFATNFFGALQVTQAFLPLLRQQRSGHIFQVSSHGGVKAFAGFGIYNASKFALEGASEALAQEVAPLGIRVTIVEPGPFRTQFAGASFGLAQAQISDYDATAGVFRQRIKGVDGQQEGDPAKAAAAIVAYARAGAGPLRLPLGKVALATIGAKADSLQQDLAANRAVAEAAVFA